MLSSIVIPLLPCCPTCSTLTATYKPLGVCSGLNGSYATNILFFAYFLNGQYDKCDEIFKTINEPTNRTWLLRTHSKFKNGDKLQDEVWYKKGLNEFKDLDWDNEVDRFHLNNEELQKELTATAKAQFA